MHDRLVIFDCDGVLVDNEAVWKRIADEMAAELGIALTEQDHERYRGVLDLEMYADLSRRFGVVIPNDLPQRLQAVKIAACHTELTTMPGASEAVRSVAETGAPMCVASNGTVEETVAKLSAVGLLDYFGDRVFSGCDVPQGKPAPDLFLQASRVMGVDVARCVVVEDSDTGVQGALSAGMTTLVLAPNGPSPFVARSGALAFSRFSELTDQLVRMCSGGGGKEC
ncbi:MAG: HAD family phosphatase [Chloroflexota bacterium]|nr:HAD family phosphatase [Chloroflexota bacterium]MDE2885216.1 HAD family phosphatase [Chloroflexota bacterium]